MKISEETFQKTFNIFLVLLAVTVIFRKPGTWLILLFVVYNLFFYKKLSFSKISIQTGLIIASPFLLELLFFITNDSFSLGLKSLEKSLSLFFFPLFILGNFQRIELYKLLKWYSIITTLILGFFFIRFRIVYDYLFFNYYNGVDLWEMGYEFSNSIGIHAPALNMHLAFVSIVSFFILFIEFTSQKNSLIKISSIVLFLLSFFFVLLVNTRMALFNTLVGFLIVIAFQLSNVISYKKIRHALFVAFFLTSSLLYLFITKNTFMKEKYTTEMFSYIDKIGKLDEIDHPEIAVYSSLVTRLTIWKTTWELAVKNLPFGVGSSDGKPELIKYYKETNQQFLAKYEFPVHNQYLNFLLRFGILGVLVVFLYILNIAYLGFKLKSPIVLSFFFLFLMSNITDDYLIRFDGIVFSGLWISIFAAFRLQNSNPNDQKNEIIRI